jgi:Tfp pilus assembly protein FimT
MTGCKKGFTLVEAILVILFLGALSAIAIPRMNHAVLYKQQADNLSQKIVTDFRRVRSQAISNAASNNSGFALNMVGSTPYSSYEIVNLSTSSVVDSHTIDSNINCTGGSSFQFGPLGNLLAGSDTSLTITANGKTYTITIVSATGSVKCTES